MWPPPSLCVCVRRRNPGSAATPSKYKKVYFRSEKKLVDGAFHSLPSAGQEERRSLLKPFNSGVQRRSSRGE